MSTDYLCTLNAKYQDRKWAFVINHKLRWADFDLSFTELQELVAERAEIAERPTHVEPTKFQLDREKYIAEDEENQKYVNYHRDQQLLCQACGIFKRHSRPPSDWSPADYVYCCLQCRDRRGVFHGNRCQKCAPAPYPITFEDNGY